MRNKPTLAPVPSLPRTDPREEVVLDALRLNPHLARLFITPHHEAHDFVGGAIADLAEDLDIIGSVLLTIHTDSEKLATQSLVMRAAERLRMLSELHNAIMNAMDGAK